MKISDNSSLKIFQCLINEQAKGAKIKIKQKIRAKVKNELMESHEKCIER